MHFKSSVMFCHLVSLNSWFIFGRFRTGSPSPASLPNTFDRDFPFVYMKPVSSTPGVATVRYELLVIAVLSWHVHTTSCCIGKINNPIDTNLQLLDTVGCFSNQIKLDQANYIGNNIHTHTHTHKQEKKTKTTTKLEHRIRRPI